MSNEPTLTLDLELVSTERAHHPQGMSALNYLDACSGFASRNETNEAAEDGDRLHKVMEKVVKRVQQYRNALTEEKLTPHESSPDARLALAEVLSIETVSEDEEVYLEYCCQELDVWLAKNPAVLLSEARVHIYHPDGSELNYGHYDLLLFLSDELAILFDWKFGWIKVPPAQQNKQGKGYAVAVFQKYPRLSKIGVVFVQPKLHLVTRTTYARQDLYEMYAEVKGIVQRAQAPEKVHRPGPYCDFCAISSRCSALLNEASKALAVYEGLPIPRGFAGLQITNAEDAAKAMYVLDRLQVLLENSDHLKDLVKQFARDNGGTIGTPLPDGRMVTIELKRKNASRSANSPGLISEVLKDYLAPEQILAACDPKITKLEEIFADAFVERQKAEAQSVLDKGDDEARRLEHSGDPHGAAQVRKHAKAEAKAIRVTRKHAIEILNQTLQAEGLVSRPDAKVEYLKVRIEKPVTQEKQIPNG